MMILTTPVSRCRPMNPSAESNNEPLMTVVDADASHADAASSIPVSPTNECHIKQLNALELQALASELTFMINDERVRRGRSALTICKSLETFARMEADAMAESGQVKPWFQSIHELEQLLKSSVAGENICAGRSVSELFASVLAEPKQRARLLSESYIEVGVALAQEENGKLYMCQLYRNPNAALCDPLVE
ncbi:hypothetical protein MPSEU_001046800 [Mayamaea pseudoterrestris]|nr:hypothetical protein MPSEU_001046800 [Mayamaea pseudoterrestris]